MTSNKRAHADPESERKKMRNEDADSEDDEDTWSGKDLPNIIPEGTNVVVTAGNFSGQRGTVCSYEPDDAYEGCYGIDLWSHGRPTFVDRQSLLPRYVLTLVGLVSRADLNGKSASIESFDAARQRYEVELAHDQSRIKVQAANVKLPLGARLRVHGLVSAAHHNGKLGKLVAHVEESSRYDVELADGTFVRLKREHVRL